jgi:hypothetical protein
VLLTLKAYQQYISQAAGSNAAAAALPKRSSSHDEAAALGCILQNFLRLSAGLSSSTLISWELQYGSDTVQQVLARPDLAAALRSQGCEGHPIVLDPACPTNNVAAAVADIGRLKQLAAADLARVEGDRIALLEQQLQEQKLVVQQLRQEQQETVLKAQQEQNAAMQRQAKQLAALLLQQQILGAGACRGSLRWELSRPVGAWLPSNAAQIVAGPIEVNGVPGLFLQAVSEPYSKTAYGNDYLAGIEIQLAVDGKPNLASLAQQKLPISFQVVGRRAGCNSSSCTSITLPPADGYYHSSSEVQLEADVTGTMIGSAGVKVLLTRRQMYSLELAEYYSKNASRGTRRLEQKKNRTLKLNFVF